MTKLQVRMKMPRAVQREVCLRSGEFVPEQVVQRELWCDSASA